MVSPNKGKQSGSMNLSYTDMVIGHDGSVLRRDQIAELRKRHGYCMECSGEPVRLFNVRKSRINPLWSQKEPRTVEGESFNGQCISCHPELDPRRSRRRLASLRRESSRYILNSSNRSSHSHASCMSGATHQAEDLANSAAQRSPVSSRSKTPPEERPLSSPEKEARRLQREALDDTGNASGTRAARLKSTENNPPNSSTLHTELSSTDSPSSDIVVTRSEVSTSRPAQPPDTYRQPNEKLKLCRNLSRSTPILITPPPEAARPFAQRDQSVASLESRSPPSDEDCKKDPDADFKKTDDDEDDGHNSKTSWQDSGSSPAEAAVDETENIIEGLHSLVADMMGAQEPDFLAEIILNAMRSYPYEERIQAFALQLIANVCKENVNNITSMIYANATRDILRAMEGFISSAEVQENGCGAILCLSVNPSIRAILVKAGACARIVRALWVHIDNESMVRQAIGALRSFSPEKEAHDALKKDRASTYVAQAMEVHKSDVSIQRDGCAFLSNSVVNMDSRTVAVVSRDEAAAVVGALIAHRNEPSVAASAIFALKNYTYEEKNNRLLRQSERIFDALAHVLQASDLYECRANAAAVLDCLHMSRAEDESLEEQIMFSIMDIADGPSPGLQTVEQLCETMRDYDFSVKVVACSLKLLRALAEKSEAHRERIISSGALKDALGFMNRFEFESSVQEMGCWLLASLCDGDADTLRRQILIREGSCKVIIKAMQKHGDDECVLEAALTALSRLACEAECFFEMEQLGNTHVVRDTVSKHLGSERVLALFQEVLTHFGGLGCDMPA